jgi:outer membrane beta-barrel protein
MTSMKIDRFLFAALAAVFSVGPAHAQDAPAAGAAADAKAAPAAPQGSTSEAASTDEVSDDTASKAEKQLEGDLDVIWGERRQIHVVQKRLFEKDGRLELTLFGSTIPNDDFIVYYPLGGRVGYHFSESFDVEASFAYAIDQDTGLTHFLKTDENIGLKEADIEEVINFYYNVDLLWSPIYGKISFLGAKLTHFDTYIGLGAGLVHKTERTPGDKFQENDVRKPAANVVAGFRWFLTDMFNVRTEFRELFFEKARGGVSKPVELSLGVGFLL